MIRRPIGATVELARICRPPVGSQPVPPNDDKWSWPSGRRCRLYDADRTLNNFACNQLRLNELATRLAAPKRHRAKNRRHLHPSSEDIRSYFFRTMSVWA